MLTYILLGWALQSTFYVVANLNYNLNSDFAFTPKHTSFEFTMGLRILIPLQFHNIFPKTVLNFRKNM